MYWRGFAPWLGMHRLAYLTLQNECGQLLAIDPMQLFEHGQAAHDPPAVAHVLFLFGSSVQATILELPFAQPRTELLMLYQIQTAGDGQGAYAGENLSRVRLRSRAGAVCAVKVDTGLDVLDGFVNVDEMEEAHQGQSIQRAIEEAGVVFSPFVARKSSSFGILEVGNVHEPLALQYGGLA